MCRNGRYIAAKGLHSPTVNSGSKRRRKVNTARNAAQERTRPTDRAARTVAAMPAEQTKSATTPECEDTAAQRSAGPQAMAPGAIEGRHRQVDRPPRPVRDGIGPGLAVGVSGVAFGAAAVSSGLTVWQAC